MITLPLSYYSGGDRGTQTLDLSNANAALYQLSYIPMLVAKLFTRITIPKNRLRLNWWTLQGLNLRPHECESCALANWAKGPWWSIPDSNRSPLRCQRSALAKWANAPNYYRTVANLARALAQYFCWRLPKWANAPNNLPSIYNIKKPLQFLVAVCAATRPPGARRWYDVCFRNRAAPLRTSISILSRNI